MMRMQLLKEAHRVHDMKFRVARFDAEIKTVRGGMDEALHVENGVMRLRQAVQRQHAEHGAESSAQHGHLEGDGDKRGPTIERAPTNIHRKSDRRRPVLKAKTAETAEE